jgi:hypothetical protein
MFQFGWCPSHAYGFSAGCHPLPDGGLPHSEIPGSMLVSSSPRLFAASHVLHRHATPRHPPHACVPSSSLPPSLQTVLSGEVGGHSCRALVAHASFLLARCASSHIATTRWDDDRSTHRCLVMIPGPRVGLPTPDTRLILGTRRVISSVVKVQKPPLQKRRLPR